MDQDALPGTGRANAFDPLRHGLYQRFVDGSGHVDHGKWLRAIAEGAHVGTCRRCGDYLIAQRPQQISQTRTDYEAQCRNDACRWVCSAPGGRYFARTSRLHERTTHYAR